MSTIDLLIYCEIYAAKTILPEKFFKLNKYAMLARWFERMSNMAIWAAINTEFKKQLGIRAKSAGNE